MRLIDADALKKKVRLGFIPDDVIDSAKTVEAIPIEWLKEWSKKYLEPVKEYTDIIEDIVNDWKEEQKNEDTGKL